MQDFFPSTFLWVEYCFHQILKGFCDHSPNVLRCAFSPLFSSVPQFSPSHTRPFPSSPPFSLLLLLANPHVWPGCPASLLPTTGRGDRNGNSVIFKRSLQNDLGFNHGNVLREHGWLKPTCHVKDSSLCWFSLEYGGCRVFQSLRLRRLAPFQRLYCKG